MMKKRITTRMNITGIEDNTLNNENYQSHRAAQRWTSKFSFFVFLPQKMERGENKRPWKMMNAGGKERS